MINATKFGESLFYLSSTLILYYKTAGQADRSIRVKYGNIELHLRGQLICSTIIISIKKLKTWPNWTKENEL